MKPEMTALNIIRNFLTVAAMTTASRRSPTG
jgi:hypothetical protein